MPATPETILAFDFGLRRIGVAVGQEVTASANPLTVVRNRKDGLDWTHIGDLVHDWRPDRLIVGMPQHADDTDSDISEAVREFIDELQRFSLPIETVDERYTSVDAEEHLKVQRAAGRRGMINKDMIDAGAAMLIAERWLKKEF